MNKFWKLTNAVDSSESTLILEGTIASESWWGDEVTPQAFRDELKNITSKNLTVVINSGGGDVFAGLSIYNTLRELDAEVTIRVDGLAASIASVIAMAGDKILMSPGSMMMIHKPSILTAGNAEDLEKAIDMLNAVEDSIAPIYVAKTGLTADKVSEMLNAETWMTAEQAVELGFANSVVEIKEKSTLIENFQEMFSSKVIAMSMEATKESMENFVAKVTAQSEETEEVKEVEVEQVETPETKEEVEVAHDDTDTTAPVVETVADTTETADDEAETEVETKVTNKIKESTVMADATKDIAQAQVLPENQATVEVKANVKDYLKTKASMEAFARILEDQAGRSSDDVRAAWKEHLSVKMGVTNPEVFLPDALIREIEDAFEQGGEIWNRVTKTGAGVWKAAWDANTDPAAESGRAKGYNRDEEEEKAEQELTFATRILRPQFVYKYITLNKEDVKSQQDTGALVRFVLAELPRRIVREVERAIVLGDGRAPGSDFKIQEGNPEGFYPIVVDANANNAFASLYTPVPGEDHYASVVKANDLIEAEGVRVLISKKGYVTDMKLTVNANGGYIFPLGADFNGILGVDAVIQPDWFTDTTSPTVDAILVVLPNYRVVGDTSIEAFTNFLLKTNKQEYLQEIFAGGGLTVRKTAVAIAAGTS